jgi:hypothetical protein
MFVKGQSGNPAGKAAIPEQLKTTLKEGFEEAVTFWFETLRNPEAKWEYRDKSAQMIANYGYGKPKESIDLDMTSRIEGITVKIVKKFNESDES